jgi:glycosidase
MRALRNELKYDALFPDASRLTTLVGNHDTRRFLSFEGATLEGAMLHTAFMLTVRGTPQLYSGEEIAMEGKDDPDNRRDFPGGFPGDDRDAFIASGRRSNEKRMYEWTREWLQLRGTHSALREGKLIDLFADDDVYVFAREDKNETIVLAFNRGGRKSVAISDASVGVHDGASLTTLLGETGPARFVNGQATLSLPEHTAVAFKVAR